uniref:Uncharacterized protein n=1 Tax=Ditylenchus dipsaci TaxID=166011 RepID=A0A915D0S0_9BILA
MPSSTTEYRHHLDDGGRGGISNSSKVELQIICPLSALLATKPVSQPQMLIMDSSSVPRRQVLMSTSSQAPPFPNPSMLQMPLVPQYCLGPGAAYPLMAMWQPEYPSMANHPLLAVHLTEWLVIPLPQHPPPPPAARLPPTHPLIDPKDVECVEDVSVNHVACAPTAKFGGPGVKKQSCIERRCLRVLENRLQRDAPTFKARMGCNNCDDCRAPDCQICLVCLDKRFFTKLPYAQQAQQLANSVDRNQLQQQQQC